MRRTAFHSELPAVAARRAVVCCVFVCLLRTTPLNDVRVSTATVTIDDSSAMRRLVISDVIARLRHQAAVLVVCFLVTMTSQHRGNVTSL